VNLDGSSHCFTECVFGKGTILCPSTNFSSVNGSLPSAFYQALGKDFAVSPGALDKEKLP